MDFAQGRGHFAGRPHPSRPFQRGASLIHRTKVPCDFNFLMKMNLAQLACNRKKLVSALSDVRQNSMRATHSGDFRAVGKLTLEAARINTAIAEVDVAELSAL